MKITYVIDFLYSINGGTERQLYGLISGMASRGHDVALYVLRETDFTRSLKDFPCPVYCLGVDSVLSPAGLQALWHFRKKLIIEKTDVVHGYFNDVAIILPPLTLATGIKVYTSRRDMGIWYTRPRLYLLRLFLPAKIRLICNSFAVADYAHRKEWKHRESIVVIHNGLEGLPAVKATADYAWAPRDDNSGTINVILVANVRPVKRIEDLIRAASLIRDEQLSIRYFIVGHLSDEPYHESLQKLLKHYQMTSDFHFIGPIPEPRAGLDRFDIGVSTSESEGFSNTIMEYLDAGVPVVASRVGGNQEMVSDGYNGYLYEAGDHKALAGCLYSLVNDTGLRKRLASHAKESVLRFDTATMIERHEKEYSHAPEDIGKIQ